jgi:hypothetical protein
MKTAQLKTSFVVYASTNYKTVEKAVELLKGMGFDAIQSCEANKPYAVKIDTTFDRAANAMDCVGEVLKSL